MTLGEKFGRILIPMVTPFSEGTEDVNLPVAEALADNLIKTGACDTLVVAGTTGEFNTLMYEERVELMRAVHSAASGRVPLIAGTGAASTREAEMLTREAARIGYDAVMVVAPYYCKPNQDAIYDHYVRVAASADIDIMLYNIPIFTGVNVEPATVQKLSRIKNIRGIKDEAGVNPTQMTEYRRATSDQFTIYNGDDIMVLCGLVQGASGVISGGSHLIPKHIRAMIDAFFAGDMAEAGRIHHQIDPLFKAFCQNGRVNPIPILRAAIEMIGFAVGPCRMPLNQATDAEKACVRQLLESLGVL